MRNYPCDLFGLLAASYLLTCLGDPLVQHGLYEQLMLDNAHIAGWGLCVEMCVDNILPQVAKLTMLYRT